jgi:hypothetical protein
LGGVQGNITAEKITAGDIVASSIKGNIEGDVKGNIDAIVINAGGIEGNITTDRIKANSIMGDITGNVTAGTVSAGSISGPITGGITGDVDGDVLGNVLGGVQGNIAAGTVSAGSITGPIAGDITGDVDGDVLGNVLGGVSGNITAGTVSAGSISGPITGGITGDVDGDVLGNVLGGVQGNITAGTVSAGSITGPITGDVDGDVLGNVLGGVKGNIMSTSITAATISGNIDAVVVNTGGIEGNISAGSITGPITGDVDGDVLGNVLGGVSGNITAGTVSAGSITGPITGDVDGDVLGNVLGGIQGNITATTVLASNISGPITGDVLGNVLGSFSGTVTVDSSELANAISASPITLDASLMDAFGRQKVSNPFTLLDNKFLTSDEFEQWANLTVGNATTNFMAPHVDLDVFEDGDKAIRQSRFYVPYQPGKGLTAILTGTLETSGGNVTMSGNTISRIGLFDDENDKDPVKDTEASGNGYFFQLDGTSLSVVERSFIDGSPQTDTVVPQSMWNVDKFDGSGPSGILLDPSKRQIFVIELEWLGVGTVVMGLFINRKIHFAHIFYHANRDDTRAYISRPTLPVRYELSSTGAAGSMTQICSTVVSDGGYSPKGSIYIAPSDPSVSTATLEKSLNAKVGPDVPIIALRLKPESKRTTLSLLKVTVAATSGSEFRVSLWRFIAPDSDPLTGASWTSTSDYSGAEYDIDASAITFAGYNAVKIEEAFGVNQNDQTFTDLSDKLGTIVFSDIQGNSDVMVVTARGIKGAGVDVIGSMQWQELE